MLGGSSGVNLNFWTHASQKDIDDWGRLGNKGWSWNEIFPYFAKSETYYPPPPEEANIEKFSYIDPALHGEHGPVENSFPSFYGDISNSWSPTFETLGIRLNGDPKNGLALGPYNNLLSYEPKNASRSFAATAYYRPNARRPNLKVLTDAYVNKVIFAPLKDKRNNLVATGLSFTAQGKKYVVDARKEVIISAGTFQSPQLLELSGIGGKYLLRAHGIKVLKDNPNVGQNLQDHLMVPLGFQVAEGEATSEAFRNPSVFAAALENYRVNHTGPLATGGPSALLSFAQVLSSLPKDPLLHRKIPATILECQNTTTGLSNQQHPLVLQKLLDPNEASAQELFLTGGITPQRADNATLLYTTDPLTSPGSYFTIFGVLEHPFSRGTVHIQSADPDTPPAIDPNYLSHPYDIAIASAIALHLQTLAQTFPLSSHLDRSGTVFQPGYKRLTTHNVASQVRATFFTEYHPVGTCAMLPARRGRGDGGVVDERLRVHGTANLRVVDASVFPLQVRGNLQTLVYAVAERAAAFVIEDWS